MIRRGTEDVSGGAVARGVAVLPEDAAGVGKGTKPTACSQLGGGDLGRLSRPSSCSFCSPSPPFPPLPLSLEGD